MSLSKPPRRSVLRTVRSGSIGGSVSSAAWTVAYLLVMGRIFTGLMCLFVLAVCLTVAWRSDRALRALDTRRPDYSAIARMEREVWGETFSHEGAAGTTSRALSPGLCPRGHSTVTGDPCFTCQDEVRSRQFPRDYDRERGVLDGLTPGATCYTVPWMLDVDEHGQWWLAACGLASRAPGGTVQMRVERRADGFHAWPPKNEEYKPRDVPDYGRIPVRMHRHGR